MTIYVMPQRVDDPSTCRCYHAMDLPGLGSIGGDWDPRSHSRVEQARANGITQAEMLFFGELFYSSETFRMRLGSGRSVIGLSIARQDRKEVVRRNDADTGVLTQIKELLIASDQVVSVRDTGRREHQIILRIASHKGDGLVGYSH
jgi:hypothetical protein